MHDALKKVLQAALPRMVGANVMVADELLEDGGSEAFTKHLHRMLSARLADFIVESKVLDGSDESCFAMVPDDKLAATRCEARLHALTPKELEALVTQAFEAGIKVGRAAESYGAKPFRQEFGIGIRKPWENPYAKPELSREQIEAMLNGKWDEALADKLPSDKVKLGKGMKKF